MFFNFLMDHVFSNDYTYGWYGLYPNECIITKILLKDPNIIFSKQLNVFETIRKIVSMPKHKLAILKIFCLRLDIHINDIS